MPKFTVGFYYEISARTSVEAGTQKEAEEKVMEELAENGIENIERDDSFSMNTREYDTFDAE